MYILNIQTFISSLGNSFLILTTPELVAEFVVAGGDAFVVILLFLFCCQFEKTLFYKRLRDNHSITKTNQFIYTVICVNQNVAIGLLFLFY